VTLAQSILAFALAAGLLTIAPGLDTALVLRVATVEGRRRALVAGAGICCGLLTWGVLASAGLAALLAASREAYDLLRLAGAGYVVYLGLRCLMRLRAGSAALREGAVLAATGSDGRWFARGLLTNLLNPKVGVFYVTFLPQFVPAGANAVVVCLALAAVHAAEGLAWFCALASMAHGLGGWLRRERVRAWIEGLTGFVFIGFGVKLARLAALRSADGAKRCESTPLASTRMREGDIQTCLA
jgi:threonine/homoserine/homoserine lactone efflux protein